METPFERSLKLGYTTAAVVDPTDQRTQIEGSYTFARILSDSCAILDVLVLHGEHGKVYTHFGCTL